MKTLLIMKFLYMYGVSKLLSSGFESIPLITVTQLTYQTKRQVKNYQLMTIFQTLQKMTLQKRNGKISIL